MFGSNSYLGLTNHPKVMKLLLKLLANMVPVVQVLVLNGTLDLHLQLEKELAEFVGKEDAIIYSTGFQVNLGVVSCVTGRGLCNLRRTWSRLHCRRPTPLFLYSAKIQAQWHGVTWKGVAEMQTWSCKTDLWLTVFSSMEGDIANLPRDCSSLKEIQRQHHGWWSSRIRSFGPSRSRNLWSLRCNGWCGPDRGTFSKSLAAIGGLSQPMSQLSTTFVTTHALTSLAPATLLQPLPRHVQH